MKQKNRYNPSMNYTDFIYYLVNILFNFLKHNTQRISTTYNFMVQIWIIKTVIY